ncbi:MAG: Pycsar system effector family protein [Pseudomonadota bacterium]
MAKDSVVETAKPTGTPDGVHLLRTAMTVQYQLSQMADQKANMVLAATFVIFTITVSQVRIGGAVVVPLLILGAAAFMAATLAILAVLPSVKTPPRAGGPANVLFFGSFTQISEAEFVDLLTGVAADQRTVYEAFAHDIYQNGRVLAFKKYRYLGYAYRILLAGLVASFLAFIVPFAFAG